MNRKQLWMTVGVVVLACSLAAAQRITTFDAPGAGTGAGQGTFAQGINAFGTTWGYYIDGSGVAHGFIHTFYGGYINVNAPGAGTASGQGTFGYSLNPEGTLVGNSIDSNGVIHGYLRTVWGTITTFDAPGAGTGAGQGTIGYNINPEVRSPDTSGTPTAWRMLSCAPRAELLPMNVAGAGTGAGQGTGDSGRIALNAEGTLTGAYHRFTIMCFTLMCAQPDGTFTAFNAPGAGTGAGQGTDAGRSERGGLDPGTLHGFEQWRIHGFVRAPDGTSSNSMSPARAPAQDKARCRKSSTP